MPDQDALTTRSIVYTDNTADCPCNWSATMISKSPTLKAPAQSSATQNTSVGSGSRPTSSRYPIPTSAPSDPHTLGRDVPGSLK